MTVHSQVAFDVEHFDGWENTATGFGTSRDKTEYSQFYRTLDIDDGTLEALYAESDLFSLLVDLLPEEMFRVGYQLEVDKEKGKQADEETGKEIAKALREINAHEALTEADSWGRLYGGAVLFLGVEDGRPAHMPLELERQPKKLEWLLPLDRRYVSPLTFYQKGPKAALPETYMLHLPGQGIIQTPNVFICHESRLIRFGGAKTTRTERMARNSWDNSILLRAYKIVRSFDNAFKSAEVLITDGPQGVLHVKNLRQWLSGNGKENVVKLMREIDLMRSTLRALVIDADEKFERQNFTFSGLSDVLDRLMLRLSSAYRVPVTVLMGQSPAGMNSTGDSDFRWFYNNSKTRQVNYTEPKLRRVIEVMCACKEGPTLGTPPKNIDITWHPLWEPTAKEKAEIEKLEADTSAVYIGADVITPEEVALSPNFPGHYALDREVREKALEAAKEAALADPMTLRAHAPAAPGEEPMPGEDPEGEPIEGEETEEDEVSGPPGKVSGKPPAKSGTKPKAKGKFPTRA